MRTRQHETTEILEQKKTNSKTPVGPTKDRNANRVCVVKIEWLFDQNWYCVAHVSVSGTIPQNAFFFSIFSQNMCFGYFLEWYVKQYLSYSYLPTEHMFKHY